GGALGGGVCGLRCGRGGGPTVAWARAAIRISCSPWRMRIALWTPVTPARESASWTGGADACMSRSAGVSPPAARASFEESEHRARERLRPRERRQVRHPRQLLEGGAGDLRGEEVRDPAGVALGERTAEDARRA